MEPPVEKPFSAYEGQDWRLLLMVNAPLMKTQVADDPELRAFFDALDLPGWR